MVIKKSMVILITICIVFSYVACSKSENNVLADSENTISDISIDETDEGTVSDKDETSSAVYIVNDMNAGWNLGNTLENTSSVDYEKGVQIREAYSCIASYSPKKYDVWNTSPKVSFSVDDGTAVIEWDLSSIKSAKDSKFGSFGIQVYNWAIGDTGSSELIVEITKAAIAMQDGSEIELDTLLGEHSLQLVDGIAKFYPGSSQLFSTTGELMEGNLHIEISIKEYLEPVDIKNKEEYYETLLKNPVTSKEMIDEVAAAGFGAVRIPVTYRNHIDEETGLIDENWLQRIEEVVGYVLDNNMYCIINIHHDTGANGWLKASQKNYDENYQKFETIWEQVATRFAEYDNKLLFEGFNEILDEEGSWSNPADEACTVVNELNQTFVNTIRGTGGNNADRCLLISTYGAIASEDVVSRLEIPKDSSSGKIIVQVHVYAQQDFTWQQEQVDWTTTRDTWGTTADKDQLDKMLSRMYIHFVSKGIPVVIGEFGAWNKSNLKERIEYTSYYVTKAKEYGIICFWWDVGGSYKTADKVKSAALLNRNTLEWYFPELVKILVED